ncbi:bifunctional polynucleotide phosphatase/kinase [Paraphaeosphaeria minitans]|uniref:Bifunctional polynucleotide phosphatase/kinase n=1 Tax=Paraphaeosphaeria minitans TaxID=565426 RepID=A0A9P6KTY7_9PLEO|nr:bifunctional polynucleotide phosphatase/kinase [Paraphaeosphaeria minitans]
MPERPGLGKRPSSTDRGVSPPPAKRKQQSTTTNKAVANFFTPLSKKEPDEMAWRVVSDSLLIGRYRAATHSPKTTNAKRKIAAFDFDSTLITPASGKKFGRDATDWKWWHGSVPQKLRQLHEDGYVVAVLSNQAGISLKPDPKTIKSDQKRLADFKAKVTAVFTQLELPISIYAATGHDRYRKPRVGMWEELREDYDVESAGAVDLDNSFFVGDAAGREASTGRTKDFSCGDRNFAANVGIDFHTPEEYFLGEDPSPFTREFDPTAVLQRAAVESTDALTEFQKAGPLEIVLFCGSPGAGKSSFYWRHLQPLGYARVNQDILKTRERCMKAAEELIGEGTSVAIGKNNTNADRETRAHWTALAKRLELPIRCVVFTASSELCEHNNAVRALNAGPDTNPEQRLLLPKLAFASFKKRYQEPAMAEGFQGIVRVDFRLEGSDEQQKLWSMFWL